jgi:hypothetical protein
MKKFLFLLFVVLTILFPPQIEAKAHIEEENLSHEEIEARGMGIFSAIQDKLSDCPKIGDDEFGYMGEYFMGLMMGEYHEAMDELMENMMGEEGTEAMHEVLGKRLSGCDKEAAYPYSGNDFMPMMNIMMGGWSSPGQFNPLTFRHMMGFGYGGGMGLFGTLGFITWIVWLLVGIFLAIFLWQKISKK